MKRAMLRMWTAGLVLLVMTSALPESTITIYMIGDSTMANKAPEKSPETGWGQVFGEYFQSDKVKVDNHAKDGRSTKSFVAEKRWEPIKQKLTKGDYVFIEFGHNDEKIENPILGTTPAEFKENLARFIRETREKQAIPVLMTPVSRRSYYQGGVYVETHGEYGKAVKEVAIEQKVAFIDMLGKSQRLILALGNEESKKLFNWADSGVLSNYPKGVRDNSHFIVAGAHTMAKFAVEGIKELKLPLTKYLKTSN